MQRAIFRQVIVMAVAGSVLAGCQDGSNPFAGFGKKAETTVTEDEASAGAASAEGAAEAQTSTRLVDRDVEAPEVFQVTDQALWDGRPSLGGVWVASPDAVDPERVILRNTANGKFVIGALFRRERDNPGPKLQISSDAAAALGLLAGQPAKISVTALRREEAPTLSPDAGKPILDSAEGVGAASGDDAMADAAGGMLGDAVATQPLDAPAATAAPAATPAAAPAKPAAAKPAAAKPAASAGKHRIQIGIFSVEANAKRAADALKKAGIAAEIKPGNTQGKAFWSVTASGDGDKAALLAKVKGLGFDDAYALR
jgi:hypothetical protein